MPAAVLYWHRWIAYALLGASFVGAMVAARYYIRARRAKYYHSRQSAMGGLKRWSLVSLVLILLAVLLLLAPQIALL